MPCFRESCRHDWADHLPVNVVRELMRHASISKTAEFHSEVSPDHEAHAQWVVETTAAGRATGSDAGLTPRPEISPLRLTS